MKMCDSSSNKKKDKSHKNKHGRNGIVALRRAKRCLGYESASEPLPRTHSHHHHGADGSSSGAALDVSAANNGGGGGGGQERKAARVAPVEGLRVAAVQERAGGGAGAAVGGGRAER